MDHHGLFMDHRGQTMDCPWTTTDCPFGSLNSGNLGFVDRELNLKYTWNTCLVRGYNRE